MRKKDQVASCQLRVASWQLATHDSQLATTAFTLTELLVVLALVVLVLAAAVPAIRTLTGSRSVEAATNQVSAYLQRARAAAIYRSETVGLVIFRDATADRTALAMVEHDATQPEGKWIDFSPGVDVEMLAPGIAAQVLNNCMWSGGTRTSDGYLRSGVIFFSSLGELISIPWAVKQNSALGRRMGLGGDHDPPGGLQGQFGLVLYEREAFENGGFSDRDSLTAGDYTTGTPSEETEEQWLDANATPLLVGRYTGTLVRTE